MTLDLLLARAGVEVLVLERHADFLRDFRGDTIHPSTLKVMNRQKQARESCLGSVRSEAARVQCGVVEALASCIFVPVSLAYKKSERDFISPTETHG